MGAIWGGPLFLGGIAVGFLILYIMKRQNWWALIPGGVMLTLAVVAGLSATAVGPYIGAVFFVGLALTFASVYILPNPSGRMSWALIVAGILFANGLLIILATEPVVGRYWPVVLILVGAYLLFRRLQTDVAHGAVAEPSGSPRPADSAGVQSRQQLDSSGDTRAELSESVGATEVLPAQAADDAAIQSSEAQGEERDL